MFPSFISLDYNSGLTPNTVLRAIVDYIRGKPVGNSNLDNSLNTKFILKYIQKNLLQNQFYSVSNNNLVIVLQSMDAVAFSSQKWQ